MSEYRKQDITDQVLSLTDALLEGGRGFEVGLALSSDKGRGVATVIGMVLAGAPVERIAQDDVRQKNEVYRDHVLETLRDHEMSRVYNQLMNIGNDRRTSVVVAAMVADELMKVDPEKLVELLEYSCRSHFVDPYTRLGVDVERLREHNPALVSSLVRP